MGSRMLRTSEGLGAREGDGAEEPGGWEAPAQRRWCEQGRGVHGDRPTCVGQGEPSGGEVGNGFGKGNHK